MLIYAEKVKSLKFHSMTTFLYFIIYGALTFYSNFTLYVFAVQFTANYADRTVEVKQLGTNPCFIEGKSLIKNDVVVLSCDVDSKLNFLEDKYHILFSSKKKKLSKMKRKPYRTFSDLKFKRGNPRIPIQKMILKE